MTWIVLKFGGASVSRAARWRTIAGAVRRCIDEGHAPVVVCSAVIGVSRQLQALLEAAVRSEHEPILASIESRHRELAAELDLPFEALLGSLFAELRRVAQNASITGEYGPRLYARTIAMGEAMATTLGAAFLCRAGVEARLVDARELLEAVPDPAATSSRRYVAASPSIDPDPALQERLGGAGAIVTQGSIARDADGDTVLLGDGGADTAAAALAAKLQALRLEIWSEVPGVFTGDPWKVPGSRLVRRLGYDEAEELANTGARSLHPRCIDPLRRHGIALHVKDANHPEVEGTVVEEPREAGGTVKAIVVRTGLSVISVETLGLWQRVGFLAEISDVFKRHGLSIVQVATSASNLTLAFDPAGSGSERVEIEGLVEELSTRRCQARAFGPCTSVSLVGRNLRTILHRLAPALELFEQQPVFLVTQAASDLNLTFVLEEAGAEALVTRLHEQLFGASAASDLFGATWQELRAPAPAAAG